MTENSLTITIAGKTEDIDILAFLAVVKNTVAILRDLETDSPSRLHWVVTSISKSSPVKMRMAGIEDRSSGGGSAKVVEKFLNGMKLLESGSGRPENFTDPMLDRALNIVRPLNSAVSRVIFSGDSQEPVSVTQHVAANVDRFRLPDQYKEFGELEGELGQITVHKTPYDFCIYDPLTDHRIKCFFEPDDLVNIRDHLKERIRVSGLVAYRRRDDVPLSITVEDWSSIPHDKDLPSIEELHALKIDFTGARKSEDVIAELRRSHA